MSSWKIEGKKAIKKTDKSFYNHRGTGVPMNIIHFFDAKDLKLGEAKKISLFFDGYEYNGRIAKESLHLGRTRMFWATKLGEKFNEIYTYSEENKDDSPHAVFEKITDNSYRVYLESTANRAAGKNINLGFGEKFDKDGAISGTTNINKKRSKIISEYRDPDSGVTTDDEKKIDNKLRNNYKIPRTPEEAEMVLKQIKDDIKNMPAKEQERVFVVISRSPAFAKLVKEKYSYKCQICGASGFEKAGGGQYAEAHHTSELSKTKKDNPDEMICVCPTCHRIIHYGTKKELSKRENLKNN